MLGAAWLEKYFLPDIINADIDYNCPDEAKDDDDQRINLEDELETEFVVD